MVFAGDCGFCRVWIARWRRGSTGIDYVPYQEAADWFPGIPREEFARAVHLMEPCGKVSHGAEAVFRALALGQPRRRLPLWLYRHAPGVAPLTETAYRLVAARRQFFSGLTRWLFTKGLAPVPLLAGLWSCCAGPCSVSCSCRAPSNYSAATSCRKTWRQREARGLYAPPVSLRRQAGAPKVAPPQASPRT